MDRPYVYFDGVCVQREARKRVTRKRDHERRDSENRSEPDHGFVKSHVLLCVDQRPIGAYLVWTRLAINVDYETPRMKEKLSCTHDGPFSKALLDCR